ncbi:Pal1 cell morphology protein-domain-containing protein [Tricharina praecox]|uniref:Pal1 cell morphology protein-domain-containing protein n=1 Tax=Tricharina praecox TaxID=43433 RepID=UPI00221E5704|nr:Pal1 cell morphology protein-domain-containing protein [Tricharina praecox]KAI5853342.1 Pal1 cell morphology protein-domain-containing protein [Tricharina praecox]
MSLGTNNPFRARLAGAPGGPTSPQLQPADPFSYAPPGRERPKSRNPFLDVFDDDAGDFNLGNDQSRHTPRANSFDVSAGKGSLLTGSAKELFENLTISDMNRPAPPNAPRFRPPPPGHHKSSSAAQNEGILITLEGSSRPPPPPGGRRPPPPPGSRMAPPPHDAERSRNPSRRPRRNSDSSVIDVHEIEARDRQRRGDRRPAEKGPSTQSKSRGGDKPRRDASSDRRKKPAGLDVIDKLDVTGIYGSGLFHHDGPFDACNPHRNKSSRRLAPVQAFPADSANNSMSGFGPLPSKADHSHIFGNGNGEAFNDYTSNARRPSTTRAISFDPKSAIETLHGDESLGLGTSTFLDGAPASKLAIQKTVAEGFDDRPRSSSEGAFGNGGGIQRKKSLVQKFRSMKPGETPIGGRRRAPPPPGNRQRSPSEGRSPTTPSSGGDSPFFNDYDDAYDKKGETISVVDKGGRERVPNSPKKPHLNRVGTDEGNSNGLMKRVRSLSKPKRRD